MENVRVLDLGIHKLSTKIQGCLPSPHSTRQKLCISRFHLRSVPTTRFDPRALAFFFSLAWQIPGGGELLSCQIPRDVDEKRGQMPRLQSTLQHFPLIAHANSAILSILMCGFLFQLTSSFVIALGF